MAVMTPTDTAKDANDQARLPVRFHREFAVPELGDTLEVWILHRDSPWRAPDELESLLTHDELARARRYSLDEPRRQFILHRASLRLLLGSLLHLPPRNVAIALAPDGKPVLANGEFHFNVAHSGAWGAIAVAKRPVGIDVEVLRSMPNADGLVNRYFSPEEREQYARLPDDLKLEGFFRGWICKEAVLKTTGVGLRKLESCCVDLDPRLPPAVHRDDEGAQWQLTVETFETMRLCVAVQMDVEGQELSGKS